MSRASQPSRRALFGSGPQGSPEPSELPVATAQIERTCLAYRGIVCQSCGDVCEARAIRFGARRGGPAWPVALASLCTGCGDCAPVCPIDAIRIEPPAAVPAA